MYHTRKIIALTALTVALALTGCSKDGSSPVAPNVEPIVEPTVNLRTTVTIKSVEVIKDGDGIAGKGEFYFWRQIGGSGRGWARDLSSGESDPVNWTRTFLDSDYTGEGLPLDITFGCTEYDVNILGASYPDSDMDNREATAHYVRSPSLQDTNYITLGNDKCKVRMHYTITSALEPGE